MYTKECNPITLYILLPNSTGVADYPVVISEALRAISNDENRSQLEIFHDLKCNTIEA